MMFVCAKEREVSKRNIDHNDRDVNSHLLKRQTEEEHECLQNKDFNVIGSEFRNNTISEVL